jgi:hypothetical protein
LIAEKQESGDQVGQGSGRELGNQEQVLECETGDGIVATDFSEVVLVGTAEFLDDAVQAKALEQPRDLR